MPRRVPNRRFKKKLMYMSRLVKHLCNKRNKQIKIGVNPDIQERINKLIRLNQIRSVNEENRKYNQGSRKWWDTVNRITGRKVKANNLSLSTDPKLMNHHFHYINTDPQYSTAEPLLIPEGTRIPVVDVSMVENFMVLTVFPTVISGADNYSNIKLLSQSTIYSFKMETC